MEINNTDAEGRLVLADGVFYARNTLQVLIYSISQQLQAEVIIDMATLTGAQSYASGHQHASILTNSDEWENRVRSSSLRNVLASRLFLLDGIRVTCFIHCPFALTFISRI